MRNRLLVLRITCDIITGKAQYPLSGIEEVPMPANIPRGAKFDIPGGAKLE